MEEMEGNDQLQETDQTADTHPATHTHIVLPTRFQHNMCVCV